jgi:hypothetical protein
MLEIALPSVVTYTISLQFNQAFNFEKLQQVQLLWPPPICTIPWIFLVEDLCNICMYRIGDKK